MDGRSTTGDEQLLASVLGLAGADPDLPDDARQIVLGALESDALLQRALNGACSVTVDRGQARRAETAVEPVGAFLKSIRVRGFRGIGPEAHLALQPSPGLTIVAGRNGSGKSTFAEAFELALTGDSYRWRKKRSTLWREHWRNIHDGATCAIRVEVAEEGAGVTTVGVDWAEGAELDDRTTWVRRGGRRGETGLDSLGWSQPIELFRPMLSYDELGGLLEAEPSKLHDALAVILGLERVSDAQRRLTAAVKKLQEPQAAAKATASALRKALAASPDERAARALALLRKKVPDLDAVRQLATGTSAPPAGELSPLRGLVELRIPTPDEVRRATGSLRAAIGAVAETSGTSVDLAERRITLLRQVLELHEHQGDVPCPVCGVGTLDESWRAHVETELAQEDRELQRLRRARVRLGEARRAAHDLIAAVPAITRPGRFELSAFADVRAAWQRWSRPPREDAALADHLEATHGELERAVTKLREEAAAVLADREDAWAPLATRLAAWVDLAREARSREPMVRTAKRASEWLKENSARLRNQRLAPLALQAREIWAALRQESNVELGAIMLEGQGNRRRVDLRAEVDGAEAGALGVMSQGELHALALALFLPRATMPDSPFRFLVLDDPIQAMDPAKVDGFVQVLSRLAERRQVVVLSHDDRLPEAVRRMAVPARILEVYRGAGSTVQITNALDPARRYVEDAFALARDDGVPDDVRARILPGLCRMAVEAAARDAFLARRFSAGATRAEVESAWQAAQTLAQRLALAVHDDKATLVRPWINARPWRRGMFKVCGRAVHSGLVRDPVRAVRDAERTARDLREGVR